MNVRTEQFDLETIREEFIAMLRSGVVTEFQYDVALFVFGEEADNFVRAVRASKSKDELWAEVVNFFRSQKQKLGDRDLALEATKARYGNQIDEGQIEAECRRPSGRTLKIMKGRTDGK